MIIVPWQNFNTVTFFIEILFYLFTILYYIVFDSTTRLHFSTIKNKIKTEKLVKF